MTDPTVEQVLLGALDALLDSCGARGTYHALKYWDAVEAAETALAHARAARPSPSQEEIAVLIVKCALGENIDPTLRPGWLEQARPYADRILALGLCDRAAVDDELEKWQIRAFNAEDALKVAMETLSTIRRLKP